MGSIIHPWNVVMLFMVTSVAANVHIVDDMDVGLLTGDHPESHGGDTSELQHTVRDSIEDIKSLKRREKNGYEGNFHIRIKVMAYDYAGTSSDIYLQVHFASGRTWGEFEYIHDDFWMFYVYKYDKIKTYYGRSDRVKKVRIHNPGSDAFFPDYIIVNCPEVCDRYICEWERKCSKVSYWWFVDITDYRNCFVEEGFITIPCKLANENSNCP